MDTDDEQVFRLRVQLELKRSPTFRFWWYVSELWARLRESESLFRR